MRFCRKTDTGEYFIHTPELMARGDMMLMPEDFDPRTPAPEPVSTEVESWEVSAEPVQAAIEIPTKGKPGRPRKA